MTPRFFGTGVFFVQTGGENLSLRHGLHRALRDFSQSIKFTAGTSLEEKFA